MAQTIQIKRSTTTATPASLAPGELAFSGNSQSNSLFIGEPGSGASVIRIGGAKYEFLHQAGLPGVLTNNAVPIVNATGYVDEWKTAKLFIGTANVTSVNSVANSTHLGLASNTEIPTTWAVKEYVDAAAVASTLNGLTDVSISSASNGQVLLYDGSSSEWKNRTVQGTASEVDVVANNTHLVIGLPADVTVSANLAATNFSATGAASIGTTLGVTGAATFSNTIAVTGNATFSNTLSVDGSATFGSAVTVTGNLTVLGSVTTVNTTNLVIEDPLIKLALNNDDSDAVDIGLYGVYGDSGTKFAGIFRDASDGKFKFFRDLEEEPTTTVNSSGTGYALATVVGAFEGSLISSSVTITGGTITGITDLATADGGTGLSSFTSGGVFYASNTSAIAFATGAQGEVLQINDSGLPVFDMLDGGTF